MSLLEITKLLLRKHRIVPKRRLGQNFMVDSSVFERMSNYALLGKDDVVLDVGAGLGVFTRFLAARCKKVLAVEVDAELVKVLHEQLKGLPNVEIICGNVLNARVPSFNKIVACPPYQISSQLITWFYGKKFECAVAVFQKDFAERLVAPVAGEDYGWLTVLTYYRMNCELLDAVPKTSFYPQPKIDSTIIRLTPRNTPPFQVKDEKLLAKLVPSLFTQRNRKVRNAILPLLRSVVKNKEDARLQADSLPFKDKRVRELAPEDFGKIANALSS
ncbi:MAG: 16S rRNA (adenine(1518)-N(6)/adenine(1519)-N(6))-dimethyltransferase RsmA [Candidatus Bathyarchaeia archaeon]